MRVLLPWNFFFFFFCIGHIPLEIGNNLNVMLVKMENICSTKREQTPESLFLADNQVNVFGELIDEESVFQGLS